MARNEKPFSTVLNRKNFEDQSPETHNSVRKKKQNTVSKLKNDFNKKEK